MDDSNGASQAEIHLLRIGLRQGGEIVSAAVDCASVQEVIESPRLEPVPGRTALMLGVVEVRGVPVPVVPLAGTLGASDGDETQHDACRLVVCSLSQGVVAFQVSQIKGIAVCAPSDLQALPIAMAKLGGVFCCDRVLREPEGYRFVIDVSRCLEGLLARNAA